MLSTTRPTPTKVYLRWETSYQRLPYERHLIYGICLVAASMVSLLRWVTGNLVRIVRRYGAFLLLAGAFLAFLLLNGGIVVGTPKL